MDVPGPEYYFPAIVGVNRRLLEISGIRQRRRASRQRGRDDFKPREFALRETLFSCDKPAREVTAGC
jgi:hypothetical protein